METILYSKDEEVIEDIDAIETPVITEDTGNVECRYMTLSDLGLTYKQFIELSDMSYMLDIGTICNIFDMNPNEVSELYRQAGIYRPYIEPRSIEAMYCVMLWLYLTGRAQYGLNAYAKIEYLGGAIKKADRAMIDMELFTQMHVASKLNSVLKIPSAYGWMSKYIAEALVVASEEERRSVLTDIMLNGRSSIVRPDYAEMEEILSIDALRYRRRRICYSKFQVYCLMDRLRIESCHWQRSNKKTFDLALCGSMHSRRRAKDLTNTPLPDLGNGSRCAKTILKCLRIV